LEKRRGTNASLYLAEVGLADEASSDAIPEAAGGEGGHGAAKPHGVIHRYLFNQPIFRNFSRLANVSSRETGSVQCGRGGTGQVCSGTFIT
jgi:hypothetical protein